jgi:prolipoprotein diacylglyceryl transferase
MTFIIWDVDPEIFTVPFLNHTIRWYGLCWALGFLFSQQIMFYIYKRERRSSKEVETLTIYTALGTILGARLGHVIFYDPINYLANPLSILAIWEGGLASHGAVIGILLGLYLFARKTAVNYLWIVDRVAIVSALTAGLVRFGNLMNSEMVGLPTTVSWAFVFTRIDATPRHPAQMYEAIYYFFLFLLLVFIWYRYKNTMKNGLLFGLFLTIMFTLRFVAEFVKVNQVDFEDDLLLNMGQLLSIPFIVIGIIFLFIPTSKGQERKSETITVKLKPK